MATPTVSRVDGQGINRKDKMTKAVTLPYPKPLNTATYFVVIKVIKDSATFKLSKCNQR